MGIGPQEAQPSGHRSASDLFCCLLARTGLLTDSMALFLSMPRPYVLVPSLQTPLVMFAVLTVQFIVAGMTVTGWTRRKEGRGSGGAVRLSDPSSRRLLPGWRATRHPRDP